ncbi:MAG: aminopeptidase P family protein [Isosphaeraceae bacterium]|nr:aminopeptidase P family protein [Isosphaeraceae bacterium]
MPNRTAQRREQLRQTLPADQIDALLVSAASNVTYLTGFTGDSSTLLLTRDRDILISDGRYTIQLQQECPDLEIHIRPVGQLMIPGVAEVIGKLGLGRLGFEATALTVADYEELKQQRPGVELRPVKGRVEALRAIKDPQEIATIREVIGQAERAFARFRAGLRADQTEKEATDNLEHDLRRCGADGSSFPPIVAVGPNAALPHYRGSAATRIGDADFVLVDWGATGRLYKSDLTRVLVTGKVTSQFEQVYRAVLAAQERAIAAIRPGVSARDVDAEARSVIDEAGFGPFFTHGLGHGIGLDIHEAPRLHKDSDVALQPGMVLTIEPGIYLPGWGGIRIEDDILVTSDGHEVLTQVPKSLEAVYTKNNKKIAPSTEGMSAEGVRND